MAFKFHLPDIGEGVVEGEIVSWKVAVGDKIKLDQPLVEVMTDKATVEIPSPRAGTVTRLGYKVGEICPVGAVLVEIDDGNTATTAGGHLAGNVGPGSAPHGNGGHAAGSSQHAAPSGGGGTQHGGGQVGGTAVRPAPAPVRAAGTQVIEVVDVSIPASRVLATPATRRLARQMGIEIGRVAPTGKHGRVTTEDVKRFSPSAPPAVVKGLPSGGEEERIPLRGMRKRIADSMSRSVNTAAHFTYVEEIDMTELVAVRERAKGRAQERGVKLTYLPFIVKAIVSGLRKWPQLNASLDEATQEIVRKKYYHVGIAAQGPHGLVVTVVRDADKRSIFDLSREIDRLGEAVRANTATREELTGSTFTVSSLGKLGGVLATPIINFPEVAIVGVHKIEEKPAVRAGQIVARHLMNLSISVDHRLADGYDGAMFLQDVKALLEDPTTMFMEMV